jgi:hypothetical protein
LQTDEKLMLDLRASPHSVMKMTVTEMTASRSVTGLFGKEGLFG